jgi:hypothetical protein
MRQTGAGDRRDSNGVSVAVRNDSHLWPRLEDNGGPRVTIGGGLAAGAIDTDVRA